MRVREGMEAKHDNWVKKMALDPRGAVILKTVEAIASQLESGETGPAIFEKFLLKNSELNLSEKTKVALAISVLCENGDKLRFTWNAYYKDEEWALGMELGSGEKKLADPR